MIETHEHKGEVKGTISTLPIHKIAKLAASEIIPPGETVTEAYELTHIKNDKFNRKNHALAAVREPLCPFTQWMR